MQYDEEKNTKGLIAGSIGEARRYFKDGEPNDEEGEKVFVHWKQIDGDEKKLVNGLILVAAGLVHYQKDEDQILGILDRLLALPRDLVFVLNEVGQGIIPDNPLARKYAEWSGRIGATLGSGCEEIWYCVAGHPMRVK